ncbi:MAG: glycosyltransferase [bacterium]
MKILQINKFYYRRGGADHHFLDLCDLLESKGHLTVPFSMHDPRNLKSLYGKYFVSNVEFFENRGVANALKRARMFYSCEANKKLKKLLKKEKPELAHVHLLYHQISPTILPVLKKAGIPVVMTIHDWKMVCPNYTLYTQGHLCTQCRAHKYYNCLQYRCIKNTVCGSAMASAVAYYHHWRGYYEKYVDLYIAPSQFVKDMLVKVFAWPESKIEVLAHFVDPSIQILKKASPLPTWPRFAYVGRLSEEKGIKRLVHYWHKHEIFDELEIIGDGPLKQYLADYIEDHGLAQIKLRGRLEHDKIYKELSSFTAVVVPSLVYETFGLTAIEAFARGVPVVANAVGALPELVNKSKAGILFSWHKGGLRQALDQAQDQKYRQSAIEYINCSHGAGEYYEKLMGIYSKIVK